MLKYFGNKALKAELEKYKTDNVTLISRVGVLESSLAQEKDQTAVYFRGYEEGKKKISELEDTVSSLQGQVEVFENADSKKVTYASARKVLTKAKLKQLRESLEAVPAGANGFSGSCSVYDKKTKRLSVIQLTSKEQALEILSRAEKGHVDIVL
jgi:preprotein translocase subunit SecD